MHDSSGVLVLVRSSLVQTCRPAFSSHRAPPLPPPRSLFCKTFAKIQKLYKHKNGIESTCCAFPNPYYLFCFTITKGARVFSWVIDTNVVVLHKNIIQRQNLNSNENLWNSTTWHQDPPLCLTMLHFLPHVLNTIVTHTQLYYSRLCGRDPE